MSWSGSPWWVSAAEFDSLIRLDDSRPPDSMTHFVPFAHKVSRSSSHPRTHAPAGQTHQNDSDLSLLTNPSATLFVYLSTTVSVYLPSKGFNLDRFFYENSIRFTSYFYFLSPLLKTNRNRGFLSI